MTPAGAPPVDGVGVLDRTPHGALVRYRVMAWTVGVGLLVLVLVGVPLKYAGHDGTVVSVVGPVHGFLYMVYLVAGYDLARRGHWRISRILAVVAGGFLPGLAFVVERIVTRRVLAESVPPRGSDAPPV